uniref:Uncharacterized protein n=1 Tax=Suricata suricatta TaxID=37032 RepID=A0A673U9G9_SURSU
MVVQIFKKRRIVANGLFKADMNELFTWELGEDGYSRVKVSDTTTRTEIIILVTRTQNVLGEKGQFGSTESIVELYAKKVATRGLVLGIKTKLMLPWDPSGKIDPTKPMPDHVSTMEPQMSYCPPLPSWDRRCKPEGNGAALLKSLKGKST